LPRDAGFSLAVALRQPSFTPGRKDADALVELVIAGDTRASAALVKLDDAARDAIGKRYGQVDDAGRALLVRALGRLGDEPALLAALADAAPRVRRSAASALARLASTGARAALTARMDAPDVTADERRVLVEALARAAGVEARDRLLALDPAGDAEMARRRDRALLIIERDAKRTESSSIAVELPPPAPVTVRLHCKPGLAGLLADDFPRCQPHGDAAIDIELASSWQQLFASHLWISAGVRIPLDTDDPSSIAKTIASPAVRTLLAAWTRGPIRWRLGFARGHRRAVVWRIAREVATYAPELVNDPRQTTWDILVDDTPSDRALEIVPRAADPRFEWRVAQVPASSHPTVAAALARVAGVRSDERVWDPFVGSGAELVECARRGQPAMLAGSDTSETALAAARANLEAAHVSASLVLADARQHTPGPVDVIVTNPPLGSRVRVDAGGLLVECLGNFARQLAPGGRLVWITPVPRKTEAIATRCGLRLNRTIEIDLGGVHGRLERWDK
jgi:hypothetical protein